MVTISNDFVGIENCHTGKGTVDADHKQSRLGAFEKLATTAKACNGARSELNSIHYFNAYRQLPLLLDALAGKNVCKTGLDNTHKHFSKCM